jgi:serine/threonine protein kinase
MTKPPGVIASFFRVHRCLGTGSYGEVYEAVDERTRARVAVKLEPADADFPQLVYEHRVLKELGTSHGFPRVLWFESNNDFNVLVMQKLGPSVEDVRVRNGGTLPVDSVMNIGRQVLERLACCHAKGLAYRDMKPQNVLYEHVHVESSSSSSSSSSLVPLVPPMSSSSSSSSSPSVVARRIAMRVSGHEQG